jgi:acyl-CoA dehydrogenase
MAEDIILESFEKLLTAQATTQRVNEIDHGGDWSFLWQQIEKNGFVNMMLEESHDGASISFQNLFEYARLCGKFALPNPLIQSIIFKRCHENVFGERDLLPITFAIKKQNDDSKVISAENIPFGKFSKSVLVYESHTKHKQIALLPLHTVKNTNSSFKNLSYLDCDWKDGLAEAVQLDSPYDWHSIGAAVTASLIAGALESLLELTLQYAKDRKQFGRAIGKFQAIQQQISVLTELAAVAKTAAQLAFQTENIEQLDQLQCAIAKAQCSVAATKCVKIAHAIHGAIGVTAEYQLQLFTRRLLEWSHDYGNAEYWHGLIGEDLIRHDAKRTLHFLTQHA